MSPKSLFRLVAIAEAVTWTLLIAGLAIRAVEPELRVAVTVGGGIHGFVFLAYAATAVVTALNQRWSLGTAVLAVGSAVIPYATIPVDVWLHRSGRLEGAWRVEAGDDPRDARAVDRLLRWFLARPLAFLGLALALVTAVFAALLLAGPPGGQ
ncbi:DUF3817 domain-containing protein [Homoserinibacter sp. YIM 151385]|uniref:DUF3817 domain-containing protein n=1 Tax=Homoserinibacter sp. YIM 151385 TaxID=2985506 RepID=UPI0022F0FC3E|nr:DUF3817 domain-containing protein [Homoserinibacter sp. YIM 151385]WBU37372.1 DUF3817 domain-containing protein [Homoserinibacter sp. YIM 151385]